MAALASASDSSADLDERFMARANDLALRGWGRTYPNPIVGALIVRDGAEVGAGWHHEFGEPHAEVVALAAAGAAARGATLYSTLEPCTHTGKQPPCVDAIVAAGVARVVIAVADPNPDAAGGAEALRQRGVTVEVGTLDAAVARRNFRFLRRFAATTRPFVAIKLAVSMDGMIADARGHSRWVSGESARAWAHWLRAGFGAVAAGARTVLADDARLTARGEVTPRVPPVRVVFDRSGKLRAGQAIFADAAAGPVVVVTGSGADDRLGAELRASNAEILVSDDLATALTMLARRGIDSIVVEGGGELAGALLHAGLVDRIYQVQCPVWLGAGTPAWHGLGNVAIETAPRWRVMEVSPLGECGDTLLEMER